MKANLNVILMGSSGSMEPVGLVKIYKHSPQTSPSIFLSLTLINEMH